MAALLRKIFSFGQKPERFPKSGKENELEHSTEPSETKTALEKEQARRSNPL